MFLSRYYRVHIFVMILVKGCHRSLITDPKIYSIWLRPESFRSKTYRIRHIIFQCVELSSERIILMRQIQIQMLEMPIVMPGLKGTQCEQQVTA